MKKIESRSWKLGVRIFLITIFYLLTTNHCFAQFTTDRDTLVIVSGDSATFNYSDYDATADTSGGTPYTGTAGFDLNGKILVGVDFDSTSAWTAATFSIYTSATYNSSADTTNGTPYDWKLVNYEGDAYTFTPETGAINIFKPQLIYALKRYVMFVGASAEAAPRKLIPLIRSGF